MNNFFSGKFGKTKKISDHRKFQKVYFQRKINTENYPNLQKNLQTFFNDYSKYFETSFDNNHIIVGKKYDRSHKNNLPLVTNDITNQKFKNKKLMKRPTLKRPILLRKSDSFNISKLDDKRSLDEKENNLKPGQRFIDDKEIERLFNLYRELRKINKNKCDNFINLKELKDSRETRKKTFKMASSMNKKLFNSVNIEEKKFGTLIIKNNNHDFELNNESEYYRTLSTNVGGNNQDEQTKNNFKSIEFKEEQKLLPICKTDLIERRNKLIEKQMQYLYKNIQSSIKNQFAEKLALQENVFLNQRKSLKNQKNLYNNIRSRIKKDKNYKLLLQDNTHRENIEFKKKLDFYQNKFNPDRLYDWYDNLHSYKTCFPFLERKIENIRNPKSMKNYTKSRNVTLEKDQYLKNVLPMKYIKNLDKDINNINNNYEYLCVNGKNLLQLENEMAKKLRGRKIINDFERVLTPSKVREENFFSDVNK